MGATIAGAGEAGGASAPWGAPALVLVQAVVIARSTTRLLRQTMLDGTSSAKRPHPRFSYERAGTVA